MSHRSLVINKNIILFLLFSILLIDSLYAQKVINPKIYLRKPGHIYVNFIGKDSTEFQDIDLTEKLKIIVEFKEPPLFHKATVCGVNENK